MGEGNKEDSFGEKKSIFLGNRYDFFKNLGMKFNRLAKEHPMSDAEVQPAVSKDDTNLAMIAHLLGFFFWIFPGLVVWLMNKDKPSKAFVSEQAKEALNFQITLTLAYIVSAGLSLVLIGFVLLFAIWAADIIFCILAAIRVSNGINYRYPFTLRLLK